MFIKLWDEEMSAIGSDFDAIARYHNQTKRDQRRTLIRYKLTILQLQSSLSTMLEKMIRVSQRKAALSVKPRSLVHWGGMLSERVHEFYFSSIQLAGKEMWLNLLRSRIPGNSTKPNAPFSDEHLVELANRLTKLKETERQLGSQIVQLQRHRSHLEYRYQDLCTIVENRNAAATLGTSFGNNLKESCQNPILISFQRMFWSIVRASSSRRKQASYLSQVKADVDRQSEKALQRCRNSVIEGLRNPGRKLRKKELADYRSSLKHIEELQEQLAQASALLFDPPPETRPILLKNKSISGTTFPAR